MTCPFCDPRLAREGRIAETEHFYSIYNLKPVFPGHVMIIPHEHHTRLSELPSHSHAELFSFLDRTVQAILATYETDSYDMVIQEGPHSGQSIEHFHLHILPRHPGDIEGEWMDFFHRHELTAPQRPLDHRTAEARRIAGHYPD